MDESHEHWEVAALRREVQRGTPLYCQPLDWPGIRHITTFSYRGSERMLDLRYCESFRSSPLFVVTAVPEEEGFPEALLLDYYLELLASEKRMGAAFLDDESESESDDDEDDEEEEIDEAEWKARLQPLIDELRRAGWVKRQISVDGTPVTFNVLDAGELWYGYTQELAVPVLLRGYRFPLEKAELSSLDDPTPFIEGVTQYERYLQERYANEEDEDEEYDEEFVQSLQATADAFADAFVTGNAQALASMSSSRVCQRHGGVDSYAKDLHAKRKGASTAEVADVEITIGYSEEGESPDHGSAHIEFRGESSQVAFPSLHIDLVSEGSRLVVDTDVADQHGDMRDQHEESRRNARQSVRRAKLTLYGLSPSIACSRMMGGYGGSSSGKRGDITRMERVELVHGDQWALHTASGHERPAWMDSSGEDWRVAVTSSIRESDEIAFIQGVMDIAHWSIPPTDDLEFWNQVDRFQESHHLSQLLRSYSGG